MAKNILERIEINPKVMHGKPVIRGTRIPVYVILNLLAGGMDENDILKEYPDITKVDIHACVAYGARLAEEEIGVLEEEALI